MSALWDPIFGATAVAATTGDRAWLTALCDAEAALARACAGVGLIDPATAARISAVCAEAASGDPAELGLLAAADGNPVIPLVRVLRAAVGEPDSAFLHFGATSQDILDTAAMLVAHRALGVVLASVGRAADSCALLAREHRSTVMAGRTLLQQAVPTTFGALAAGWGEGLDRVSWRLTDVRGGLAVQLGGAAGTLAGWQPSGPAVRAVFALELGLADPGTVWHSERSRIADLAGALGTVCGAIAKIATDVILLAQTEIGEVSEAASGGSSTMAHKQNPIAAVTARAAALQAPGLVATLLTAMSGELQRAAGAWHAEWPALNRLLRATGGAADRLSTSLDGLQVHPDAMRRNLQPGQRIDPDVGSADDLVDDYLAGRAR